MVAPNQWQPNRFTLASVVGLVTVCAVLFALGRLAHGHGDLLALLLCVYFPTALVCLVAIIAGNRNEPPG